MANSQIALSGISGLYFMFLGWITGGKEKDSNIVRGKKSRSTLISFVKENAEILRSKDFKQE